MLVVHPAVGWAVTPSMWTRRVAISITINTYSRRSVMVSIWKRSVANSPDACVRKKVRQLASTTRGAGPILPAARIRRIVPHQPGGRDRPVRLALGGAPNRDFAGRLEDKVTYRVADRRTSGSVRVSPVPTGRASVPGRQRGRGDDPMVPQLARQGTDQRGRHGSVWLGQTRLTNLVTQHGDLVAEYQQLGGHLRLAPRDPG